MKHKKLITILALVIIVGIMVFIATKKQNQILSSKDASGGNKLMAFELKDLNGKVHKVSDYSGKKVYIKFWASWCSICLAGLADTNALSASNKDFQVVTIVSPGVRGEKNSEDFKKWFNSLNYKNIEVLLDENGVLSEKLGVRGYPTSMVIGSDGTLAKTLIGDKTNDEIKAIMSTIK